MIFDMEKDIYIPVHIHTEKDLPVEEGYYFVMLDDKYDRPLDVYHWYKTNNAQGKQDWLTYVKFWLKPVTLAELVKITFPPDKESQQWFLNKLMEDE